MAARIISDVVKTSLGPRGMDKMLVDTLGDVTITNDGATILKELDVQHPAAKMMVEISKTTDNEVGDGTTSAVVLAGALLEHAEELVTKDVHPTLIVDGYGSAADEALKILDKIAIKITPGDRKMLEKVARTSMFTKLVSEESSDLAKHVVEALISIAEKAEDANGRVCCHKVDLDNVKVEKKPGGSLVDTKLIKGIVLDKEVVHAGMPKRVDKARIALINAPLEIEKTEFSAEIRINDPTQMKRFLDEENRMLKEMVDKLKAARANVIVCQKGIDDIAQHYLAKANIVGIRRVKESDMTKLAKATGATIITNLNDLTTKELGHAELGEERKLEDDKWFFIEGCKNPKAVTLLIRGGSQRVVDEAERSVRDAVMVVKDVILKPQMVVGGGAPEAELAYQLQKWAEKLSGREQLAAQKFTNAIEAIPTALAHNAGLDPLDTQVELRSKHSDGKKWFGIDVSRGKVADLSNEGIVEPLAVKEQIIKSSSEAVCMILRIDDVISSSKMKGGGPPPGGEGGMGGMGDMD
jgi:thermosome